MNRNITFCLQLHQPWRLKQYSVFDIASDHDYFNSSAPAQDNQAIFNEAADKSYIKMTALLERLMAKHPEFKLSLDISGAFLDQAELFRPEIIDSLKRLVDTGRVDLIASPYYHGFTFLYDTLDFGQQVDLHREKIRQLFNKDARVLANTELAYNDNLARWAAKNNFRGILLQGDDKLLDWRSPNYVYGSTATRDISLLMNNYRLADDISHRFSDKSWEAWPLDADKYCQWLKGATKDAPLVNLFINCETFGIHQPDSSGIFEFFEYFVEAWLSEPGNSFYTALEAIEAHWPVDRLSSPEIVTSTGSDHNMSAWDNNDLQKEAIKYLYALGPDIIRSKDSKLIEDWRKLQASDYLYYLNTTCFASEKSAASYSPYSSPYDAFLFYMNAIRDIRWRLSEHRYKDL